MKKFKISAVSGGNWQAELNKNLKTDLKESFEAEKTSLSQCVESIKNDSTNSTFRPTKDTLDTTKKGRNSKSQIAKNDLALAMEWNNNTEKPKHDVVINTGMFTFKVSTTEIDFETYKPKMKATKDSLALLGLKRKDLKKKATLNSSWIRHDKITCQAHTKTVHSQQDFIKRC